MPREQRPPRPGRGKPVRRVTVALETSIHYGRGVIAGISDYSLEAGNWSLSLRTRTRPRLADVPRLADGDGLILQYETGLAGALAELPIPLVNVTAHTLPRRLPTVCTDHRRIGQLAAEHLMERGFTRFAALADADHHGACRRCRAFTRAVRAAGHRGQMVLASDARRWLRKWLADQPWPLGVFAFTDGLARELAEAAWELGWAIPDQLAIVGVDSDPLSCQIGHVTLSSVAVPLHRIGYEAARLLDRWMDAGVRAAQLPPMLRTIAPTGVILRRSSDTWITGDPLVAATLRYIRDNVHRPFNIDELADHLHANRRQLERRFRKGVGHTIGAAITRSRLERAQQLLAGTSQSVGEIARACGFTSTSYFGKVFRRFTGRTPVEFRHYIGVASL